MSHVFVGRAVRRVTRGRVRVPGFLRKGLKGRTMAVLMQADAREASAFDPLVFDLASIRGTMFGTLNVKTGAVAHTGTPAVYELPIDKAGRISIPKATRAQLGEPAWLVFAGRGRTIQVYALPRAE
jgi:DNA-binding transcriptional regulator/RsmH inhibitor MraZ